MNSYEEGRWSIPLTRLWGVPVRVHLFFCVFAIWSVYIAWHTQQLPGNQGNLVAVGGLCLSILFGSVFLQECARLFLLRAFGGRAAMIVLGPYGGISNLDDVQRPRDEMLVQLAAPVANAAIAILASIALLMAGEFDSKLLHPLQPNAVAEGALWIVALKLCLWTNALLFLLHSIPAFPFHGGRALRAAILWRAPHLGRREASRTVIRLARLIACLMVVAAVFLMRELPGITSWSALLLLAVLVFLGAEHEQVATVELPAAQTMMSVVTAGDIVNTRILKRSAVSEDSSAAHEDAVSERLEARQMPRTDERFVAPAEDEVVQEVQVDEILMRVHEHGLHSLSDGDRAILERASRRYRQKIGSGN